MTFDEFISKYTGKPVDFDGYYGVQCMDLMHQYHYDVLGLKDARTLAAPLARNVYENFNSMVGKEYFEKIANTPTGVPQKGDIMFWNNSVGDAGHVAIFISGDENNFKSFDANWPVGTNPHVQSHTYAGVYGWLRYKAPAAPQPQPDGIILADQSEKNAWTNFINYRRTFPAGTNGQEGNVEGFMSRLIARDGRVTSLETDLANAKKDSESKDSQLEEQAKLIDSLTEKLRISNAALEIAQKTNTDKDGIIRDRETEIGNLTKSLTECQAKPEVIGESELKKQIYDILYSQGFFLFKYWKIKSLIPKS